jgi:hypothetical protein
MDVKLSTYLLYNIADALGMMVEYDAVKKKLLGETSRDVFFGKLPVSFDLKIVSTLMLDGQYMCVCKVIGNLGLLVISYREGKQEKLDLHLLNAAKTDALTNLLEKKQPKDRHEAVKLLGPAIVKSFSKADRNSWKQAA